MLIEIPTEKCKDLVLEGFSHFACLQNGGRLKCIILVIYVPDPNHNKKKQKKKISVNKAVIF